MQRRRDFLQLMLDARTSKEHVSLEHFDSEKHAAELDQRNQLSASDQDDPPPPQEPSTMRPQKKMITEDEIVGQAFVFLLAGYETSSNTLAFTCYLLAINPECQRRVQEEVDEFYTRHVGVTPYGLISSHFLQLLTTRFKFQTQFSAHICSFCF